MVLVSSSRPSFPEVTYALNYMAKNANAKAVESKKNLSTGNSSKLISNDFASEYAKAIWQSKGYPQQKFDQFYSLELSRIEKSEHFKTQLEMAGMIGLTIGCALPWGRGIGLALSLVKSVCLVGMGIPLNVYFALDSNNTYKVSLRNFFSAVEADRIDSRSFQDLDTAHDGVVLSSLF